MIDPKRREIFTDLYRLAEYYENPPFCAGDIEGNAKFFEEAMLKVIKPYLEKHNNHMAAELAIAVIQEASDRAAALNKLPKEDTE